MPIGSNLAVSPFARSFRLMFRAADRSRRRAHLLECGDRLSSFPFLGGVRFRRWNAENRNTRH